MLVSSDDALAALPQVVTTIPLTTRQRAWPTRIAVTGPHTGLSEPSWAACEQVRTISTERLSGRIGTSDEDTLEQSSRVLRYLLGL